MKYLDVYRLAKEYPAPNGPAVIVRDFNLAMDPGEFVCLIGHSGCGKSTVLSMIAGLVECTNGAMILADKEIDGPGPDRGVVFQAPCLLPWMTALGNVLLGVQQVHRGKSRKEQRDIAVEFLSLVGLSSAIDKYPSELSSGMRQRVGIARAFALSPKMLLLDEPFGMLDSLTRFELQQVLLDLWTQNRITALMVTHDVDEALFLADRIVMMTSGPAATVGGVITTPFPRPRERKSVMEHPAYYSLREQIIGFLEGQDHRDGANPPAAPDVELAADVEEPPPGDGPDHPQPPVRYDFRASSPGHPHSRNGVLTVH